MLLLQELEECNDNVQTLHEERLEEFKKKNIRFKNRNGQIVSINLHTLHFQTVQWIYTTMNNDPLVPSFITATFNHLPYERNGVRLVNKSLEEFRHKIILQKYVGSHYNRRPDLKIIFICIPEFGRGEREQWHLHGLMLSPMEIRSKMSTQKARNDIQRDFQHLSPHNQEFDIAITDADHIGRMVSYMLKKAASLPEFLTEEIPMTWGG